MIAHTAVYAYILQGYFAGQKDFNRLKTKIKKVTLKPPTLKNYKTH